MFGTASFSSRVFFFVLLVFSLCQSCADKKVPAGECYYETVDTHAEVIALKPHNGDINHIDVIMDFKASSLALADQEMGALKGYQIDRDFIERNNIEIGNKYEVQVSELVKGDCDTKLTVAFSHEFN